MAAPAPEGEVFAFLAAWRGRLFPGEMVAALFTIDAGHSSLVSETFPSPIRTMAIASFVSSVAVSVTMIAFPGHSLTCTASF